MIKNVTIIMKQTWFADDNTKITILTKNKKTSKVVLMIAGVVIAIKPWEEFAPEDGFNQQVL